MVTQFNSTEFVIWTFDLFQSILLAKLLDSHPCTNYNIQTGNQQFHMRPPGWYNSNFLVFPPTHFVYLKVAINPLASFYSLHPLHADLFREVLKKISFFKPFTWSFWQNNIYWNTYFFTVPVVVFLLQHCFLWHLSQVHSALFDHWIHFNFMHLNYSILSAVIMETKIL